MAKRYIITNDDRDFNYEPSDMFGCTEHAAGDWVIATEHLEETARFARAEQLLRTQLAARDAVLDAVLKFATQAHNRPDTFGSGWGSELLVLLQRHGVHPK